MEIENSSENYQGPVAEMIYETDVKAEEANNARITDIDFTTGPVEGALVPVAVTRDVTHTVENSEFENESGSNDAESDAYSSSSEEGSKTEEEELSPILCSKVKKQIAEKAAANKFSYDLMQKDLMNLKNDIAKIQEDIPRTLASQRKEFLKHGFPIKMIPSFDPTENDFVLRYGGSNALAPGELVFSSLSIANLPIPFVKVISEEILFETNVQLLNVERNVLPKSLCCLGCYAQKTETCLWCGDCGIPYCTEALHYSLGKGSGSFSGGLLYGKVGARLAFRYFGIAGGLFGIVFIILHYTWIRKIVVKRAAEAAIRRKSTISKELQPLNGTQTGVVIENIPNYDGEIEETEDDEDEINSEELEVKQKMLDHCEPFKLCTTKYSKYFREILALN